MENRILIIGYEKDKYSDLQKECFKYGFLVYPLDYTAQVLREVFYRDDYLSIVIFSNDDRFLDELHMIRNYTKVPILIVKDQYDGMEKIAAIKEGADEYMQCPETISEWLASCHALARRYTDLNVKEFVKPTLLFRDRLLISMDHRKVFIDANEIELPKREFDLLSLLVSEPERVFTYEQLFDKVWKGDYVPTDNSLHSCINRIRRKLEKVSDHPYIIENVRGVGYCLRYKVS